MTAAASTYVRAYGAPNKVGFGCPRSIPPSVNRSTLISLGVYTPLQFVLVFETENHASVFC